MRIRLGRRAKLAAALTVTKISLLVLGGLVSTTMAVFLSSSATADSSLDTQTIAAPTLNTAASQPAGALLVSWSATPTAAQRTDLTFLYYVYRSRGGASTLLNPSGTAALTYSDTPASDGTWTYTVVAGVSTFRSPDSNAVSGVSDRVAPAVSISCDSAPCTTGWYRSPVTVAVSATDSGSGVNTITYVLDGASTIIGGTTVSFRVSGDGAHTIRYWATDQAGNTSAAVTQTLDIDSTPPVIGTPVICDLSGVAPTLTGGWLAQGTQYRVLAGIADATSGVGSASATVTVAGTGTIAGGTPLTAQAISCGGTAYTYASAILAAPAALNAGSGTVTISASATDVAGNTGSATGTGSTDNTAPTLKGVNAAPGTGSGQLVAAWQLTDATSGPAGVELVVRLAGTNTSAPQYPNPIVVAAGTTTYTFDLTSGTRYDIYLTAADNAGNNSAPSTARNKKAP